MKRYIDQQDSMDIVFYQDYVKNLYLKINKKRDFEDLYCYLHRTTGYLGKAIELGTQEYRSFVLPISWLFSVATHLNINVQEVFIKKYPGICPYCLESQCVCYKTGKTPFKPIPAWKMRVEMSVKYDSMNNTIKIFNLDTAVKNIMDIFSVNEVVWHFAGASHHIAKIHGEIAEIHEAYSSNKKREKPLDAVGEEIADVFAWIIGAWGIMYPKKSLDDVFIDYYIDGCPLCKSFSCKCEQYDSRSDSLMDFKRLETLKENLDTLASVLPKYQEDITELIKSYEYALETHNAPIAKVSVSQTKEKLETIKDMISKNGVDLKSLSIINTIIDISETILRLEEPQTIEPKQYDVFLSYSSADRDEARQIYTFLTEKKLRVFLSEKDIKPAAKWENDIKEALLGSDLICLLATPNSLRSEWVTTEWGIAWAENIQILPILLHCSEKELPDRLRDYQVIDFHEMPKIEDALKRRPR